MLNTLFLVYFIQWYTSQNQMMSQKHIARDSHKLSHVFPTRSTSIKSTGHHDTINEVTRVVVVHTWEITKAGRLSRRSISYTLSHSRIPTNSTLQQISTVRSMSWQAELFLIVDPSLLQVLISLIIITSSQGSSSRGEWTSYFHFSVISRRTDTESELFFTGFRTQIMGSNP